MIGITRRVAKTSERRQLERIHDLYDLYTGIFIAHVGLAKTRFKFAQKLHCPILYFNIAGLYERVRVWYFVVPCGEER